ncbi:MAG: membrane protein insertion efficiency factor YidD [Proteobacteria bacterium]|nr:MAG: membrane protein insertion efficiency factor YidD [Pseudomonadota bacterium]
MNVSPTSPIKAGNSLSADFKNQSRNLGLANNLKNTLQNLGKNLLLLLLGAYRTIGTTHLGGSCRFEPSCSEYALEAVRLHSPIKAIRLISIRVCKCRPGGPYGFDPVPTAQEIS